jgi:transcriptional regulator of arginine metabolism
MKTARQNLILNIIKSGEIETQEELAKALVDAGVSITQATVSRDIKELNLIKVQTANGRYKYAPSSGDNQPKNISVLMRVFKTTVREIKTAGNIIVIKTIAGSANIVAEAVDNMDIDGAVGTLAGDNTVFIASVSNEKAGAITAELNEMIQ